MSHSHQDFLRANQSHKNGDLDAAEEQFLTLLKASPDSSAVLYCLGMLYLDKKDDAQALDYFARSLERDPYDYETMISLSYAQCELGQYDEAEATCKRAIKLQPDYGLAYKNLGAIYHDQRKFSKALTVFEEGLRHIDYLPLRKGRALCNLELGNFESAIEDLGPCLDAVPNAASLYWYRARCWVGLRQQDRAIVDAEKACLLAPDDAEYAELLEYLKAATSG